MKPILSLVCLTLVTVCINAQSNSTSKLKGTIYNSIGEGVEGAKITAMGFDGNNFEAVSDNDGSYDLVLPVYKSRIDPRRDIESKFDIVVFGASFYTATIKGHVFYPSKLGVMHLDVGLEIGSIVD